MWRQVLLPVIIVGVVFYAFSAGTTYYTQWLDASHQRAIAESADSSSAAAIIQEQIWHFHAEFVSPELRRSPTARRLTDFDKSLRDQITTLNASVVTEEERTLTASILELTRRYRDQVEPLLNHELRPTDYNPTAQQAQLYTLASQISDNADRIREINEQFLQSATIRRERIRTTVMWSRTAAMFLVPTIGIALGWWTANRLQRSVAQIQVTLHDPALATPGNLGTVEVHGGNELISIQRQVEMIVNRLRHTSEELQAARHEVLRSERLAAIGGLAAGVAHELRNPLTSVKLLLQHAASRGGEAVIATQRIGLILDEIERMEATIQGLIDFSLPSQPQRKRHDIRETLTRALHLVEGRAEKQHVQTESNLGDGPAIVDGDPQQLHQVFVNLLINGIEAMPDGGTLTVTLLRESGDGNTAGKIVVQIEDSGTGIPADLMPRLFEPFASAKERGTGLGLAISRRILEEHGGAITARGRLPRGSLFEVVLPAIFATAPATQAELVGVM
jgi:two-component system sensor histidine kinase HydH